MLAATFRRVSLPLLSPAAVNAWVWVFLHAIRELPVAVMLYAPGSVVISTIIWTLWNLKGSSTVGALGVLLIAISILIAAAARLYSTRSGLATMRMG